MPSSRSELDRALALEHKAAQRFVEKNGVGSLPGRRLETGESATQQRVGHEADHTSPTGSPDGDGLSRPHREPVSYSGFDSVEAWEDWMLDNQQWFLPMVGVAQPPATIQSLEKRSRMNHVFTFMLEQHVELLYWRHVEGMTLGAIAEQEHVTRQAIAKRLAVAEADFKRCFAAHWNDDVTWEV